jgi:hypothetical protein
MYSPRHERKKQTEACHNRSLARGRGSVWVRTGRVGLLPASAREAGCRPASELTKELTISAVPVSGPRFEASLRIELIREVDVCSTVEQAAEVDSRTLQMHRVDLKVSPIQRAVGIVVINFTVASRVFGPLNSESNPAFGAEFIARILLICRESMSKLVGLGLGGIDRGPRRNHEGPLDVEG